MRLIESIARDILSGKQKTNTEKRIEVDAAEYEKLQQIQKKIIDEKEAPKKKDDKKSSAKKDDGNEPIPTKQYQFDKDDQDVANKFTDDLKAKHKEQQNVGQQQPNPKSIPNQPGNETGGKKDPNDGQDDVKLGGVTKVDLNPTLATGVSDSQYSQPQKKTKTPVVKPKNEEEEINEFADYSDEELAELLDEAFDYGTNKKGVANSPEQHKLKMQKYEEGKAWHVAHPVNHQNIIDHFNKATADERHVGMHWYHEAHTLAKHVAHDTHTPMHTMAGLISNYSPQTHWYTNLHTAAHVARHKRALGGPGSGVFATNKQKEVGHRILNGEHYNNALKGQKTKAFAHLIEHGGNGPSQHKHVVVDRHAYSVAAGARITDQAFGQAGLKGKKKYEEVSHAYRKAAEHLSKEHGIEIHPHQVQAVTWLARQRMNQAESAKDRVKAKKNFQKGLSAKKTWDDYAGEHHPSLVGHSGAGVGYYSESYEINEAGPIDDPIQSKKYHSKRLGLRWRARYRRTFKQRGYMNPAAPDNNGKLGLNPVANARMQEDSGDRPNSQPAVQAVKDWKKNFKQNAKEALKSSKERGLISQEKHDSCAKAFDKIREEELTEVSAEAKVYKQVFGKDEPKTIKCAQCHGTGKKHDRECHKCHGRGTVTEGEVIDLAYEKRKRAGEAAYKDAPVSDRLKKKLALFSHINKDIYKNQG